MREYYDVARVTIDEHRWYATIHVERSGDAPDVDIVVCADSEHSGLWIGDWSAHGEH